MKILFAAILTMSLSLLSAQKPAYNRYVGLMVNLNTSQMNISGGFGPTITTSTQWSAGVGVVFKSAVKNMFRIEGQLAFEETGSGRATYYERVTNEWIRVYDRYRTLPISVLLLRNLGWEEKWSIAAGFKSSFVVGHALRHESSTSGGNSGVILSPEVKKWFGAPVIQLSRNFPYAEVALNGWYAVSPLIDQLEVRAVPYGISFSVRARIITFN